MDYRYRRVLSAKNGEPGGPNQCTGAAGEDLVIRVPQGTVVRDTDKGSVLADLSEEGRSVVVAEGGTGGRGNARFATSRNRAPRHAQPGLEGERRSLALELKVVADVGLVGPPNAGKSTLLARLSSSHPRIGDYPFTTLTPNLGIVRVGEGSSFVLADIPGLIEDAHLGKGLGLEFLRHVERCSVLVLVIDVLEGDPREALRALKCELRAHGHGLDKKQRIVAMNKSDLGVPDPDELRRIEESGDSVFATSGATGHGLGELVAELMTRVDRRRAAADRDGKGEPWRP